MSVKSLIGLVFLGLAVPALAHHPLQGQPMETFQHGLLSGFGHPVLGFDHLFFIIALGLVAALNRSRLMLISAYLVAMGIGCLLRLWMPAVPFVEWIIALSLLSVGGMLALARFPVSSRLVPLFAGFGFFHGAAFGVTIAAEEATFGAPVLLGYLVGLITVQWVIAWVAGQLGKLRLDEAGIQLAGAMVAGVGLFLLLEASEPMLLTLLT